MKKVFTTLLLAAMAAGCGKQGVETARETRGDIGFNVVAGQQTAATRAKEFGYWQAGQKLKVTSYETNTTTKFADFELTYNAPYTTSWSYAPAVQAPGKSISYYAYHPESATVTNFTADGHTGSFDYVAPANTEDLFVANAMSSSARVPLMFHHVLSEVNFAIQCVESFHITVTDLQLNTIHDTGHYTFSTSGGSWSAVTGVQTYYYTPNDPTVFPTDGKNSDIIYLGNVGGTDPTLNDRTNAIMVLPQAFDGPAKGASMRFHYKLVDMNDVLYKEGDAVAYLGDFTSKKWEAGKRYLYLIDFSGLIENGPITFEVIAFGWSDTKYQAEPLVVSEVLNGTIGKLLLEKSISEHNSNKAKNAQLTVFPVSCRINSNLGAGPEDAIVLKDFNYGNFVAGDQVRIFCNNDAWLKRITLDPSLAGSQWNLEYGFNYIMLTKL